MLLGRRSFLLSSAITAGACSRQGQRTQRIRLVLAGTPATLAYLPHTVAEQLNFYRKESLLIAVDVVPGGTKGAQALLGGSADVVVGFYDHSIRLVAQGEAVRSFVTLTRYPGNVIITSPQASDRIHRIEDLKHARVGVPDLGSQAHLVLNYPSCSARPGAFGRDADRHRHAECSSGSSRARQGRCDINFRPSSDSGTQSASKRTYFGGCSERKGSTSNLWC